MFDPLQIPNVWRAQSLTSAQGCLVPSGFVALDTALGGGWPTPALIEIHTDLYGIGELQLIVPLLIALSQRAPRPALILWLNPPYAPNSVALAQHGLGRTHHWVEANLSARDTLWTMDQGLRSGACAAVLAWAPTLTTPSLRRLKLAAVSSGCVAILYRSTRDAVEASPATVRALLTPRECQLQVSLLKIQGCRTCEVTLDLEPHPTRPAVAP